MYNALYRLNTRLRAICTKGFHVLSHINETVLKVIIILSILLMFIILYTTGILFVLKMNSTETLLWHKAAAFVIIVLLSVHAWLRKCTIRKLYQECKALLFHTNIHHEDNIDFLIRNTKHQSFEELCDLFKCDSALLQEKLLENHVVIKDVKNTLREISKANDKDMYQVLLLMLKLHVESKSASPIYGDSCPSR